MTDAWILNRLIVAPYWTLHACKVAPTLYSFIACIHITTLYCSHACLQRILVSQKVHSWTMNANDGAWWLLTPMVRDGAPHGRRHAICDWCGPFLPHFQQHISWFYSQLEPRAQLADETLLRRDERTLWHKECNSTWELVYVIVHVYSLNQTYAIIVVTVVFALCNTQSNRTALSDQTMLGNICTAPVQEQNVYSAIWTVDLLQTHLHRLQHHIDVHARQLFLVHVHVQSQQRLHSTTYMHMHGNFCTTQHTCTSTATSAQHNIHVQHFIHCCTATPAQHHLQA